MKIQIWKDGEHCRRCGMEKHFTHLDTLELCNKCYREFDEYCIKNYDMIPQAFGKSGVNRWIKENPIVINSYVVVSEREKP